MPIDPSQGDLFGDPGAPPPLMSMQPIADEDMIDREPPQPEPARAALVKAWNDRVKQAKAYWEKDFKRMKRDMDFAYGLQWSKDADDDRYQANVTLRSVQQKTAFLYAKNPKAICRRRERIMNTVWDGTQGQLQALQQSAGAMMAGGMPSPMPMPAEGGPPAGGGPLPMGAPPMGPPPMGAPPMGGPPMGDPMNGVAQNAMMGAMQQGLDIAMDAGKVREESQMLDKVAKTLELLYEYNVSEQTHPFKAMMKMVVRRCITTGVGWVKVGFQRIMERRPEIEARMKDASERLGLMQRLSEDAADKEIDETQAEMAQLQLLMNDLQAQIDYVAREGLIFDFPGSTQIIPDPKCIHLRELLGADWACQEFILSRSEIQEIYEVDVGRAHTAYSRSDLGFSLEGQVQSIMSGRDNSGSPDHDKSCACVWEIYNRRDGMVYVLCDGYPDFLREPASPQIQIERFFPWFALTFNECENETRIYPPSDVHLMRDMQLEYNRCRQGLREHRVAARPKTIVSAGALDDEDIAKLQSHPNNAVLELNGLQPQQDVKQLLQAWQGPGIDPNLYEVNPLYEDIMRTIGLNEANLGAAKGTATGDQISEASRQTAMGSNLDDLDDLLSQLAHAGGQILLKEVSSDTVKRVVGQGAVWPELSRQEVAEELFLEIEAGSTGRPNQAQEVANAERLFPLLIQVPGIDPEFVAKELIKRLDDRLDMTLAFKSMLPSIVAMNQMARPTVPGAGVVPGMPGGAGGASNGAAPPGIAGSPPPDQVGALAGAPPPGGPIQ